MLLKFLDPTQARTRKQFLVLVVLLLVILGGLFFRSFDPDLVAFSNDGPLGGLMANSARMPGTLTGYWQDLNSVGANGGMSTLSVTNLLLWTLGPVFFSKFYVPAALGLLGLCAWFFFRQLRLTPLAALLGALATVLNSTFFSDASWGVGTHEIALGMDFLALGLVAANTPETPWFLRWTRLALAGLCVGVNVMEGADVGALYSIFVAALVLYKSLVEGDGAMLGKLAGGISSVAVVTIFAGFIALQTVMGLIGTQIQGITGTAQDAATKARHWDFATQWSEPKKETLGLLIPGLFGYKMDTPKDMIPAVQNAYQGGVYWGGMGCDPNNDRYFDSGGKDNPPVPEWLRQSGGGNYCGILVALIAAWTIAQSLRRQNLAFTTAQKKLIWFWTVVLFGSVLLAWGRFAPFYAVLYQLPYFSTIRNPAKFLFFFSWAAVILFAYGIHALNLRYFNNPAARTVGLFTQVKNWWAKAGRFDRNWTLAVAGILVLSGLGWGLYNANQTALVHFLQTRGFPDEDFARQIAAFSLGQAAWWLVIFAAAILLLTLIVAGCFAGPRAKWAGLLLGGFLVLDLGRANLPYIIHWDYIRKYEVGSLNPIEKILTEKSYEHRVAGLPFETQQQLRPYDNAFGGNGIYRIEWMQQHFPYYNIQCSDIIQMPRMPEDLKSYLVALSPHGSPGDGPLYARQWQLTNTRYLLGTAGFLEAMNQQLDPVQQRFRIAQRFDVITKPGITRPTQLEELTVTPASDGDLALFEFTGALPRAKLYSNWQVSTNDPVKLQEWLDELKPHLPSDSYELLTNLNIIDQSTLKTLADRIFDPEQTVLISKPLPGSDITNQNSGTVEFKSYSPKQIVLAANAPVPSVLLLNDKYDPNWWVTVDGKPAELLRCNYIMRGVYLPAGSHQVVFTFSLPNKPLYVTLAALATSLTLILLLVFLEWRKPGLPP